MNSKLIFSKSDAPLGAILTCTLSNVKFEWGENTTFTLKPSFSLSTSHAISRYVARIQSNFDLYPSDGLSRTEVDHWLSVSSTLAQKKDVSSVFVDLNNTLALSTFIVGSKLTIADLELCAALFRNVCCQEKITGNTCPDHLLRWYNHVKAKVSRIISTLPANILSSLRVVASKKTDAVQSGNTKGRKEEGRYVSLPDAVKGQVVVRFPPEASGFLHIGHAKAALLNQHYQKAFEGKLIMRFDDTNPAKEKEDFEKVILEDLKLLQIEPDQFTCTSDLFETMLEKCEFLLIKGKAYVDDTNAETMKKEREERVESKRRNQSTEENLHLWGEMKKGSETGLKCCVRAKIDMQSNNGCMRDPTIYRCKLEPHPKTGLKFKVYPTYDFACPIVDSLEGVTHALRTTEYHDRDDQFAWFIEALGLRPVHIYEYSRLNMNNTVLSKRKLTWFVEQGLVEGWDDPRFPTVRGVIRRGMTVEGLKDFIVAQGSSRSVVNMEWDKIWSFNKRVIDRDAHRYTALEGEMVPVNVNGATEQKTTAQLHPKDLSKGSKPIWTGPKVFIEAVDAETLVEGQNATFIHWGNLKIKSIKRNKVGKVESVEADLNLSDTDYKKTPKLTWLAETKEAHKVSIVCRYFDHLISKSVLSKDEDFKSFVSPVTQRDVEMVGEATIRDLKQGDIIQLQRKGFFRVDQPYGLFCLASCQEKPVLLFYVPDGHTKDTSKGVVPVKPVVKEKSKPSVKQTNETPKNDVESIHSKIKDQGDKIRLLKTQGIAKDKLTPEIDFLKTLKNQFKESTGQDWKPEIDISKFITTPTSIVKKGDDAISLNNQIKDQGDKIRKLKSDKTDKNVVKVEVDLLLSLKKQFVEKTKIEWKPDIDMTQFDKKTSNESQQAPSPNMAVDLHNQIKAQGDKVRILKTDKADKADIKIEVDALLAVKKKFKEVTKVEWKPDINMAQFEATGNETTAAAAPSNETVNLHCQIQTQGDKIRTLKANKADKQAVKIEVDILLALKKMFLEKTKVEWKPDIDISSFNSKEVLKPVELKCSADFTSTAATPLNEAVDLHCQIQTQGDKIRTLKTNKADKQTVKSEVDVLLALKKQFFEKTKVEWKPDIDISSFCSKEAPKTLESKCSVGGDLNDQIKCQGDKIRSLKSSKANKDVVKAGVEVLLKLKAEFKAKNGIEWKPDSDNLASKPKVSSGASLPTSIALPAVDLHNKIKAQGDKIRNMKAQKAEKETIKSEVDALLALKKEFKDTTGAEWKPENEPSKSAIPKAKPQPKKENVKASKADLTKEDDKKKQTRLCVEASKFSNLSEWYTQVITKAEMIEYYNVSGCYILRPWSYSIWEIIKEFFDSEIKKLGVENAYFPIFVSRDSLEKEKTHIADFSPEVAWVTRSGQSELAEPVAIRPTSETVMYPAFAKWIQSHRDLPLKINQWNNVVRWEFKQPTPFLRTREFLWQEGHTAFQTKEEAEEEVFTILELYRRIYEEFLAIPVIRGRKTEKEKFAGADFTTTVEAFISVNGRAIQGATSHHLGQQFSKMFDITCEDPKTKEKAHVYQNSWGITTRTIGVLVMVHGDDKGLVMPPKVAPLQVVVLPVGITAASTAEQKEDLIRHCKCVTSDLQAKGMRVKCDFRDHVTPAWKFNHWELKGVPLRLEIGPRELANEEVWAVRRDTGEKQALPRLLLERRVFTLLEKIQDDMLAHAVEDFELHRTCVHEWSDFVAQLENGNVMEAPFCGREECEDAIKKDSACDDLLEAGAPSMGAKGLCIPFEQAGPVDGLKCIHPQCTQKPKYYTLFGRSY